MEERLFKEEKRCSEKKVLGWQKQQLSKADEMGLARRSVCHMEGWQCTGEGQAGAECRKNHRGLLPSRERSGGGREGNWKGELKPDCAVK